jgi:glycosyltransferase involved in cell wall biosynthesis
MRILHVIASLAPRYGGPSKVLPEMCRALAARGHDVEVFTTNIDGPSTLPVRVGVPQALGGATVTYFAAHWPRSYKASLGLARALHDRVDSFDVVHIHSLYLFHTAATSLCARRRQVPYVIRPHGTLDPYHRARHRGRKAVQELLVERRNLDRAAGIHCTSLAEKSAIEPLRFRAPCFVVPLGVEVAEPEPTAASEEPAETALVTFLGRLTPKKGIDILLEAFAQIGSSRPDAHLVIAGPDDEGLGRRLHERARRLGLQSQVSLPGAVTGRAKDDLLRRSSVVVLPSRDENFGVSVVEAMAAGVPVVITSGVAIHHEVAEAGAGLVVSRTPASVAGAVLRLLDDPAWRRRLGERGRRLVETTFAWPGIAARLEEMYHAVTTAPATAGSRGRR